MTCLLLLTLLGATPARPADAVPGKAVVRVVAGGGQVQIADAKKHRFPAKRDLELVLGDTVVVPAGGFVMLEVLVNQQVVRIDDDIELPVADIAALDAPKVADTVQSQIDRLLTSAERSSQKERMIGWYASQTAANVPNVPDAPTPPPPGQGRSIPAGVDTSTGASPGDTQGRLKETGSGKPKSVGDDAEVGRPVPKTLPPLSEDVQADATLATCLHGVVTALGPKGQAKLGGKLKLSFRRGADGHAQVRLSNALATPACAANWFELQTGRLSPQWTQVEVSLQ